MEEQAKILQFLGLTEYESRTLVALLSKSECPASDIAVISGVPITKLYSVLKSLENRGFIRCTPTRPKMFRPINPDAIVDSVLIKKEEKLREIISERDGMISSLERLYGRGGSTRSKRIWFGC